MVIDVVGLTKRFGSFVALDEVDLGVDDGELVALLGPSGSGKTTLLRVIAGLEAADSGRVLFAGEEAARSPRERNVGFVFQHYALFRHLTVAGNIAFGLEVRPRALRPSKGEIRERVARLLDLVQLEHFADRYPNQLSGGQRQRVALARALAIEPKVLLLDEPFGALDAKVRKELRRWLRRLHDEMRMTSVFVTHDQEEALELADRVVVMNHGRIEQIGSPAAIYAEPASPFVIDFLGEVSRLDGVAECGRVRLAGLSQPIGTVDGMDGDVVVFVRPYDVEILPPDQNGGFPATVRSVHTVGRTTRVDLDVAGRPLESSAPAGALSGLERAADVRLRIARAFVFAAGNHQNRPASLVPFNRPNGETE